MTLAEEIKAYRAKEELTQKDLAYVLDITQESVSQYETGKREISNKMMAKMIDAEVLSKQTHSKSESLAIRIDALQEKDRLYIEGLVERLRG